MDDWYSTDDEDNAGTNKNGLKRSASSQGFAATCSGMISVKETRSCSGPFDSYRDSDISKYQNDIKSYIENFFVSSSKRKKIGLNTAEDYLIVPHHQHDIETYLDKKLDTLACVVKNKKTDEHCLIVSHHQHDVETYIEGLFREKQLTEDSSLTASATVAHSITEGTEQASEAFSDASAVGKHQANQGVPTKDIAANQVVMVQPDLLMYRGRQYSIQDIATAWKKDCRMWLWKGEKKRNHSLNDLKSRIDSMSLNK